MFYNHLKLFNYDFQQTEITFKKIFMKFSDLENIRFKKSIKISIQNSIMVSIGDGDIESSFELCIIQTQNNVLEYAG